MAATQKSARAGTTAAGRREIPADRIVLRIDIPHPIVRRVREESIHLFPILTHEEVHP